MSTMTSEREAFEKWVASQGFTSKPERRSSGKYVNGQIQGNWLAWQARAHLAQPAQAVDAGAIREVIDDLRTWHDEGTDSMADSLTRALSGEKAGPVDGWQPIETAPKDGEDILATDGTAMLVTYWYGASTGWLYRYTDHGVDGWSPTHWMPLPASPAPDKEWEG